MIDIKLIRENKDLVKENIKKKFQDEKLPLVDKVYDLDQLVRKTQTSIDEAKAKKNTISKEIGALMREGKKDEAEKVKAEISKVPIKISIISVFFFVTLILIIILAPVLLSYILG